VTDGDVATHAVVLALEAHELGLFLIDLSTDGVSRKVLKTLDPTRSAAELCFQNVAAERLGPAGAGEALLNNIIDRGAVLIAFEQIGGADQALEMARNYALERYSFGRPIGSFQAIKHRLADMYIRNQLARSNAYFGAWMLSEGSNTLARAAAAARIAASDAYWFAAKETIEIFGGIGTTWEVDCHLHYRRAKQLALMVGGPVVWRERLVSSLEHDNAPNHAGAL
jgi:alkylation response protein AidB-like acyl-CoA dehydrogenase